MKHALRKYLSPCGSALFMVVSTMAALIVLVTAMYMSVLSSRQVQYATFDQEQAYVSSSTMADAVVALIRNASDESSYSAQKLSAKLVDTIADVDTFAVGDTVRTTANDITESSGGLLDSVDVLITRLDNEIIDDVTWYVYDIAVTAEKNGIIETTHTIMRTRDREVKYDPPTINNFFTATGYLPNDVIINSGTYDSQVFFDNEYVKIGQIDGSDYDKGALDMNCPLICAGSLELSHNSATPVETDEPEYWVIGNNLTVVERPYQFDLGGSATSNNLETSALRGRILVGGDFDCTQSSLGFVTGDENEPTDLYVLGNCTLGGGMINLHGNLYVNGNLIIDSNATGKWYNIDGKIYLNGQIICGDGVDASRISFGNMSVSYTDGKWTSAVKNDGSDAILTWIDANLPNNAYNVSDTQMMIDEKIGKSVYPKWTVKDSGSIVDINFCGYYTNKMQDQYNGFPNDTIKQAIAKCFPSYQDAVEAYEPCYVRTIDSDCTIQHIYNYGGNYGVPTIIFDTGDAGNTLVINLLANRDTDNDGIEDTFSWRPTQREPMIDSETQMPIVENALTGKISWNETYDREGSSNQINIITIGDGNLVVNVGEYTVLKPDKTVDYTRSIVYESTFQEFFGHYAWFMAYGGSYDPAGKTSTTNGVERTLPFFNRGSWVSPTTAQNSVHHADSCTAACEYEEITLKDDEGKDYTAHKCKKHETIVEGELQENTCYCDGRVEKSKYYGKYTYNGEEQLPNVNIFLISSSESADIRLATPGDTNPMNNVFFGYVYAPYMTYVDMAQGGGLKSVGGLIVSDYIMAGTYTYVFALPDQSITEIAGDGMDISGYFTPAGNREWRVHGY
ncbi:MAG: hypothetical protein ACI4WS_05730 [Oscillospiraceae bacterium]